MRQSPLRPLPLFCLALLLACGQAAAVETRHLDADGAGACPDASTATGNDVDDDIGTTATTPRHPAQPKAAPATAPRPAASGNRSTNPPRWHSFLPGMFR